MKSQNSFLMFTILLLERLRNRMQYRFLTILIPVIIFSLNLFGQNTTDSLAPSFTLKDIKGEQFRLKEHLGNQLTIILFWATWGHDSSEMLDSAEHLYENYHSKGLEAVGVCIEQQNITDSLRNKIISKVSAKQLSFPVVFDEQLKTFRAYNVIAVPSTFILDSQGKIIKMLEGFPIIGREKLFEFIRGYYGETQTTDLHKKYEHEPNKRALRLYNMASMKFYKEQLDTAKKYALEALASDSNFVQTSILLTEIEIEMDSLLNAENYLYHALTIEPQSNVILTLSGLLAAKRGEIEKAVRILEPLINKSDSFGLAHCYLGYTLGLAGNYARAFDEFSKAESLLPNEYRIPQLRSEIDLQAGMQNETAADKLKAKRLRKMK